MSHIHKLTNEYFDDITRSLAQRWYALRRSKKHIEKVAKKHGVSIKTVLQVESARGDFTIYEEIKRAQHPEVKYSAREDLLAYLKERCESAGIEYKVPSHMSVALYQLRQMDKVK